MHIQKLAAITVLGLGLLLGGASWGHAQSTEAGSPENNFVMSGYGSAQYGGLLMDEFSHDFTASVSPVALYQIGSDVLFEAELEFGLEGESTTTTLEYAQVDYLGLDRIQIIAGKFLLPFGLFSERLHPSWINKMPSMPLLYGHAHGGIAEGSLLPVLTDVGVMMRGKQPMSEGWALDLTVWASQGPQLMSGGDETTGDEDDGHAHDVNAPGAPTSPVDQPLLSVQNGDQGSGNASGELTVPSVAYGVGFTDNNTNKMLGGRLGVVRGSAFEMYVSGFHAMYDADNFLDIVGSNLAVDWRPGSWDVRGEGTLLWQEFLHEDSYETLQRPGYYLQVARRTGAWEPVVRWSHLPEATLGGQTANPERRQLAAGLNYWISSSIPVKLAYQYELDGDDRIFLQWAVGF